MEDEFKHLVRISRKDVNGNKTIEHALTEIKGVGISLSKTICRVLDLDLDAKIGYIADEDVLKIEEILEDPHKFGIPSWMLNRREDYETGDDIHLIESDLDMTLRDDLNRMKKTRSYKGRRHEVGLPVRGQRTKSTFRKSSSVTPPHPWNAERIKNENKLMTKYGLKNKKEIWKADTLVRRYSREARYLLGFSADQMVKEKLQLLGHLARTGVLPEGAALEDILDLNVEDILRRRLQTIVYKKGLARTPKEARMFVVHGHIALNGKKINSPSYVVLDGQEDEIGFYRSSPVAKQIEEYNKAKDNKANTEE